MNGIFEAGLQSLSDFEKIGADAKVDSATRLSYIRRKYEEREFFDVKAWEKLQAYQSSTEPRRPTFTRMSSMPQLMSPKWESVEGNVQTTSRVGELPRLSPSSIEENEISFEDVFGRQKTKKSRRKSRSKGGIQDRLGASFHFTSTASNLLNEPKGARGKTTKQSKGRKNRSKDLLSESCHFPVNMKYTIPEKEFSPDSVGSTSDAASRRRSEGSVPDLDPLMSSERSQTTQSDRKAKRQSSWAWEDSFRELVDVLVKEDDNHQVSETKSIRRLERRQSLTHIIQSSTSVENDPDQKEQAPAQGLPLSNFLDTLLSPVQPQSSLGHGRGDAEQSENLTEHTCMLSLAKTPSARGNLRRKLTRRSSMPSNLSSDDATHVTEATDMNSMAGFGTPKGKTEGRLRRKLSRRSLKVQEVSHDDATLATEASDMHSMGTLGAQALLNDDSTMVTEHSDIQSNAVAEHHSVARRKRRAGRRNSLPSMSSSDVPIVVEKPTSGQLSSFLGSLIEGKGTEKFHPSKVELAVCGDQPPRKPRRKNLSNHRRAMRCTN